MQRQVNYLLHIIIFICFVLMFVFGIYNFAHAPQAPKASIYVCDYFYQTTDKQGNIVYENKEYRVGIK